LHPPRSACAGPGVGAPVVDLGAAAKGQVGGDRRPPRDADGLSRQEPVSRPIGCRLSVVRLSGHLAVERCALVGGQERVPTRDSVVAMDYRVEIEGRHVLGLEGSMTEDEIIHRYSAKIIASDDDDYDGSTVGEAHFSIVKVGAALNRRISLMDAIDSIDQDFYEYGAAVLDPGTGMVRDDLEERFECGGDLMFTHLMTILPTHRGQNVGLVTASRLIDSYASGIVVCRPQPLQHVGNEREKFADGLAPLRQLPELGDELIEPMARKMNDLAMEHGRVAVLRREPGLEGRVALRRAPARPRRAGSRPRGQLGASGFELGRGFGPALLEAGLDQHVEEDACDRPAERLFDVVGIERGLEVAPQAREEQLVEDGGRFRLEKIQLALPSYDPIDAAGQREAAARRSGLRVDDCIGSA